MRILLLVMSMLALSARAELARVTCGRQNACAPLQNHLSPLEKDQFFNTPIEVRHDRFIAWLKPFALTVQATTGFPASILIAQAAFHSKWGTSEAFRLNKNIFDFVCGEEKSEMDLRFESNGQKESIKAMCSTVKVEGKPKLIYAYASYEDSIFAYLSLLLNSRLHAYKALQAQVKQVFSKVAPGVAPYRLVLGFIGDFDAKENYRSEIARLLDDNHLQDFDNNSCQNCLFQQRHIKVLMETTQPKATP